MCGCAWRCGIPAAIWSPKRSANPVARAGESLQTTVALPRFAVALWSPERPALYRLSGELIAGADTLHRLTRDCRLQERGSPRHRDLCLNGTPLHVRGIDYVPEDPTAGRAISTQQIRQDLTRIRELGMNVVRVPFAPPPQALARLADELGLLLLGGNRSVLDTERHSEPPGLPESGPADRTPRS